MENYIELALDNGGKIYIETDTKSFGSDSAVVPASSKQKVIQKAKDYLSDSVQQIKTFAEILSSSILNSDWCPDEFELDFSVKFSADASIIISRLNTEANIGVKLTWKK